MSNITVYESEEQKRVDQVKECIAQYEEGAITFLEAVFFLVSKVDQADVDQYNAVHPEAPVTLSMFQ
jgi:hypothetical protein